MAADKFVLNIDLGNEAMQSYGDVKDALKRVAQQLGPDGNDTPFDGRESGTIRDGNGNTVGSWEVQ